MNNGKNLEKLVRLIHETLKDSSNTKIHSNFKIDNKSQRKREFDVFIETMINQIPIKIAIECKDYKNAIPVEKIEAFKGKCDRIKGISKKIFVSSNGFQIDAIRAANDFDIDIYTLSDISKENIARWFYIQQLVPNIKLLLPFNLKIIGNKKDLKELETNKEYMVYRFDTNESITMSQFVCDSAIISEQKEIQAQMLIDFMRNGCTKENPTKIPFRIHVSGIYILGQRNKKIEITEIASTIIGWYDLQPANIIEARTYGKFESNAEASIVSLNIGDDKRAEIISTQNNKVEIYLNNPNGEIQKLDRLGFYDSNTDTFSPLPPNN